MAVLHVATFSVAENSADPAVLSVVAVAADFIVVEVCIDAGLSVSTIDWGATLDAFTLVPGSIADNVGDAHTEIWYATGLSGTETLTVHVGGKGQNMIGVGIFSGATTPDNAVTLVEDLRASPASLTVAGSAADNMIVDALRSPGGALTIGANQTVIMNLAAGGERGGASFQDGIDGGVMTWTYGSPASIAYSACRIPAATGTPVSNTYVAALEALQGISQTVVSPVEALATVVQSSQVPIEAISSVDQSYQAVLEALSSVNQTRQVPIEALQGVLQTAISPFEAQGFAAAFPYHVIKENRRDMRGMLTL